MRNFFESAVSVKFALSTAMGTMASGFAYFIGLIPDDIGKFASLLGALLTVVMLGYWRAQTRKANTESINVAMQTQKAALEIEILEEQLRKLRGE
jgi:hypothetical protein